MITRYFAVLTTANMVCNDPFTTDSVREAELRLTDSGLVPRGEGWFVVNARDGTWIRSEERGPNTDFEGARTSARFGPEERSAYRDGWLPRDLT
jgi:hypothetical protein